MSTSFFESLESRLFLSVAAPVAALSSDSVPSAVAVTRTVLVGTTINAVAGQDFRAVVGTIRGLGKLPSGYTLHGEINWGDGTATLAAQFVHQANGTIAVLGSHTYASVGTNEIKVVVTAEPPPGSDAPTRLIGSFNSKANVIASNGGVTLEETVGVAFTDTLGFFRSTIAPSKMTAVIQWGDGSKSLGKIVALPTAGPVPTYAVIGSHKYAATGSYLAHVTVYSSYPPPVDATARLNAGPTAGTASPVIVVAQFDSVINVLPPLPTDAKV